MRVICIAGARPNFMKVAPILVALEAAGIEGLLVHTGQHYDAAMSDVFFHELGMKKPDYHLNVGSGSHAVQTAAIMTSFEPLVEDLQPDLVLTVGDVNSTVACSLVAAKTGALVAHVEAGLRSRDWAMPEEVNRVVTDRISDYLLAPSEGAVANLRAEGYREDQIHLVGNVMVDSLLSNVDRAREKATARELGCNPGEYGFVTLHRPSNVDDEATLTGLLAALNDIAEELPLIFAAHPRTKAKMAEFGLSTNMTVIDPVGYLDSLSLQADAAVVLTDSGGLQEETTALGVPCLTLRENTERPITVDQGTNQVVGTDPARIRSAVSSILTNGVEIRRPALWDGKAADRIAEIILNGGSADTRLRPTDLI